MFNSRILINLIVKTYDKGDWGAVKSVLEGMDLTAIGVFEAMELCSVQKEAERMYYQLDLEWKMISLNVYEQTGEFLVCPNHVRHLLDIYLIKRGLSSFIDTYHAN